MSKENANAELYHNLLFLIGFKRQGMTLFHADIETRVAVEWKESVKKMNDINP